MLVSHVCLQEIFVTKFLVAQLAVGFNVEDLAPVAWGEALFHLRPGHVHGGGGGGRRHAGEHEVRHLKRSVWKEVGVTRTSRNPVPLQLLLRMLHEKLPAQNPQASLLRLVFCSRFWRR